MLEFLEKPGLVIVVLVALVVFGSKRLPDSARALGRSMRILKAEAKGMKDDEPTPTPSPQVTLPPIAPGVTDPATLATPQTVQHQSTVQHQQPQQYEQRQP